MPQRQKKIAAKHGAQGRSARNVINALRQTQAQKAKLKGGLWEWLQPANFAKRLNDNVTFAYIVDSVTYIISAASNPANDFISNGAPAIVNGISCIAPALIPFLPNLICICQKNLDKKNVELEEYQEEIDELFTPTLHLIAALEGETREKIEAEVVRVKKQLVDKFVEDQEGGVTGSLENIVNIIYLLVRAVGGILIMMKGLMDLEDNDDSLLEEIGKWMTVGSTAAYLLYYLICLLPPRITKYCQSRKKSEEADVEEDEDDNEVTVAIEHPEQKPGALTSDDSATSIVISQTLFTNSHSPRSSRPFISAEAMLSDAMPTSLHEPLLPAPTQPSLSSL
jgi:hypothetical protein